MIHKEGTPTIVLSVVFIAILNGLIYFFVGNDASTSLSVTKWIGYSVSALLLVTVLQFFRNPSRKILSSERHVLSPADGKVVVIEEGRRAKGREWVSR